MTTETILAYLGIALGIIGLVASYYFYKRSIRIKEPVYSIKSVNVISGYSSKYENLTVAYKGERVENFTVSKVLFYNRGAETITKQDITTRNRLRFIGVSNWEIIDASILQFNNSSNNLKIDLDRAADSSVRIDFDYLDQNQGAVIQLIHTGLSSEDLEIQGDIMGVQKIREIPEGAWRNESLLKRSNNFISFVFLLGLLSGLIQIVGIFIESSYRIIIFSLFILFIILVVGYIQYSLQTRRVSFFTNSVPEGLEKFLE